ncbi:MAG: hypothetical protein IE890_01685, partial [Arcobacter sp.]|nr:hypothetical protein [Arcobacter sp.]
MIELGEKLNKDTRPDRKKLEILLSKQNENVAKTTNSTSIKNTETEKSSSSSNIIYSIKSVSTLNNTIVIDFNVDITKNDIKFFRLNQASVYKSIFDINGYFKDAIPTKLSIKGVDNIALGQFKPNVLRIVLSNSKNLEFSY